MGGIVLSIIIPCYNVEKYIKDCVNSIIHQQTDSIVEIVLVDDCSIDGTYDVCKELRSKYDCITVSHHERNMGQEVSRNDGLKIARGEWILFLDGDDMLESGTLDSLFALMSDDIDIVLSRFKHFNEFGSHEINCELDDQGTYSARDIANCIGEKINWEMISCIGNKAYNRAFLTRNRLVFEKDYKFNEDGAFAVKAFMCADRILYSNHISYCYRHNFAGTMSGYKECAFESLDKVNTLLYDFFRTNECGKEQYLFLGRKRLGNLINSLNSEIQFGSRVCLDKQIGFLTTNTEVAELIDSVLNCEYYSYVEKYYAQIIKDRRVDLLVHDVKKNIEVAVYKQLLAMQASKEGLIEWIKKKDKIGVYGAGEIGRIVANEVEIEGTQVAYFLDRYERSIINDHIPCISPDDDFPNVDVIINTVLCWNKDVEAILKERTNIPTISLWRILSL